MGARRRVGQWLQRVMLPSDSWMTRLWWTCAATPVLSGFILLSATFNSPLAYPTDYWVWDAIAISWSDATPIDRYELRDILWSLVPAAICWLLCLVPWKRKPVRITILLVTAAAPLAAIAPGAVLKWLLWPLLFSMMLTGNTDGEFYQEGFAIATIVGMWSWGMVILAALTILKRNPDKHVCARCGYSLAGLVHGAVCPECGTKSVSGA